MRRIELLTALLFHQVFVYKKVNIDINKLDNDASIKLPSMQTLPLRNQKWKEFSNKHNFLNHKGYRCGKKEYKIDHPKYYHNFK